MKEQSHLEEMRAAVQGHRERAEQARRRTLENARALVEPETERPPAREPERARRHWLHRFLGRRR